MNDTLKYSKYLKDLFFMKKAIKLAQKGKYTTHPNPNVGCIIVKNNKIVGTGWHEKAGSNHAEVNAINMAGKLAKHGTAYISLEPCNHFGKTPPCCKLIVKSGITRVVISILDPNPKVSGQGIQYLQKHGIQTTVGILSQQSQKINLGFFKRMQTGIPWIQLKMAISIDGKTSMKNGESKWITSQESINNVHKFRALSSAILSTSTTILHDNPILTARYYKKIHNNSYQSYLQPIRIIIDSKNQVQPIHNIIQNNNGKVWLIRLQKDDKNWPKHVKQIILPQYKKKIHLKKLFKFLGSQGINIIWTECGPNLYSKLLNMNLIDELILYIAPKMLGNTAKSLYFSKKNMTLSEVPKFSFQNIKKFGTDIRVILKPKN